MTIEEIEQEENENPSYDDLLCAFDELHDEMKKILKRNNISKNENVPL